MPPVILSADIGTTSLKAAFIDLDGRLKAFSRFAYPSGCAAGVWEKAFRRVLENLRGQKPDLKIDGICISGNGPTLVPVSREEEALPPLYWFNEAAGHKILAKSLFLPHVAFFREQSPSEYEKVKFFFSSHEWLSHRLGSDAFTALPQAAYGRYYWDDEQCVLFGLDMEKFPPFIKMGSLAGKVSSQAANLYGSLGLKSGIPIAAGAPDFISALIGTGALNSGDVCDRAGSSEGINFCARSCESAAELENLRVLPHVKKGFVNIGALIPVSGRLFDLYRTCTKQESRSYEELLAELIPLKTDTRFFELQNDKTAFGCSVLCAIGFSVRRAVEALESQGFPVKAMRVSGGQGKNPLWNQLKADITGVPLMIPEICDGELAGNAVLAACALEDRPAAEEDFERVLDAAVDRMIRFREEYSPREETAAFWEEKYKAANNEDFPSA
jgi:xylulokinase